jgi:hypothetical protein
LPSPNWSRPLPRPLVIPKVMKLVTLADVRELIEQHLPAYCQDKASWRVVAKDLRAAALGADPIGVSVALRMAGYRSRASSAGRSDAPSLPAALQRKYPGATLRIFARRWSVASVGLRRPLSKWLR